MLAMLMSFMGFSVVLVLLSLLLFRRGFPYELFAVVAIPKTKCDSHACHEHQTKDTNTNREGHHSILISFIVLGQYVLEVDKAICLERQELEILGATRLLD